MKDPVSIVVYEGVSGFEVFGALAALHAAGRVAELVGVDALLLTREGARIVPERLGYANLERSPCVIIPGGDTRKPLADVDLAKALRARRGSFVLASGDAVRVLAGAGLVEGRRISRVPGDSDIPGATSVHARLVADARLLTSFPGDALIDLVLHWIGHEDGAPAGEKAAHALGRDYRPFAFGERTS